MERIKKVISIIAHLAWRGFGVFLFVVGGAAASGAFITGDPFAGVLIAWTTLMLGVVGAIGYAIATTGEASEEVVHNATNDAIRKFEQKNGPKE